MLVKLFRAGHSKDNNLEKGYWWANSIDLIKPYFKGKIVVIQIDLDPSMQKRYMLTKEIKTMGHHDGYGVWTREFSTIDEKYDKNYYYISPEYLKKSSVIKKYVNKEAKKIINSLKEENCN